MSFPSYPAYQDSGIEWLGTVPSHWTIQRLKHSVSSSRNGLWGDEAQGNSDDIICVRVADFDRVRSRVKLDDPTLRSVGKKDRQGRLLQPGNLLLEKSGGGEKQPVGAVVLYDHLDPAICSNFVARIQLVAAMHPPYWCYLHNAAYTVRLNVGSINQTSGIQNLDQTRYFDEQAPYPPFDEQVAIAAFLDRETAKIDALIDEQRRLIALLKEKRQAVISHAVTKGLDPHAPMKDSGIEWLGEVPAHWEVRRIKHVARMESGHTPDRKVQAYWEDCDIPWVSLHDTGYLKDHDYISETAQMVNALGIANSSARILPPGVVVFSRDATIGRCAITTRPMAVSQHFIAWVCGQALSAEFLLFCLRSMAGELDRLTAGATLKTIGMPDVRTLTIALPPLSEQHAIAAHARSEAEGIDALIMHVTDASRLLQERRAALISAAVTGKIDVRGSAKVLPFPIDRTRARALVGTEIIERLAGQPTFGRVKFQKVAFLAEGHVGISELAGCYTRAAAGPLDGALIDDMEGGAHRIAGIAIDQAGGTGTTVRYRLGQQRDAHRQKLADWLGPDRTAKLDKLITDFATLNTKQAEAVATLYGVWNDLLSDGVVPSDDEIISGFLNDWHPEKRDKFRASELPEWLGWMRRHGIVPTGSGPTTTTGRLFV
ncbi:MULTISPECIES: restriction endonuclease subunit S [Sphingomonas]|nr:restriction endonuclease subunit S [Sphingomonas melonis]MBB4050316.1 type I restriction enzyme S subunit [Sphingomonas zeae]